MTSCRNHEIYRSKSKSAIIIIHDRIFRNRLHHSYKSSSDIRDMTHEFTLLASPRNLPETREKRSAPEVATGLQRRRRSKELCLDLTEITPRGYVDRSQRSIQQDYKGVCSRVNDYLYVGGIGAARNRSDLLGLGITHVVNCAGTATENLFPKDFCYYTLRLNDHNSQDITRHFYNVFDFIESAKKQNGKVFIHCMKGISRSPSMAIAYIIWKHGLTFDESFQRLKQIRGIVNPNPGFVFQMSEWAQARPKVTGPEALFRVDVEEHQENGTFRPLLSGPLGTIEKKDFCSDETQSFICSTRATTYIWLGNQVDDQQGEACRTAAKQLQCFESIPAHVELVRSGQESDEFWSALESIIK